LKRKWRNTLASFELKDEQKKALKFILDNPRSGLFMQTGTGKTLTSLVYAKIIGEPFLVVAPAYIIRHQIWHKENNKFKLGVDISSDYKMPSPEITMISYDTVKNTPEILDDYDNIILEEAHCIADTKTIRWKNLHKRIRKKKRVVLLAGYPVENHLHEIYVVSLVTDVLGHNYANFLSAFFNVVYHPKHKHQIIKAIPKRGSVDRIVELIKPHVFVSNKDLFFDSPIKKENMIIRYELSDYQKNMINELSENYTYVDDRVTIHCKNDLVVYGKIMQIVSGFVYETDDDKFLHPKAFVENPKLKLLDSIVKNKRDFLLWYNFDYELEMVKKYGDRCRLSKLQTDSRGLNLQQYKFAVYFTLPLSGGQFLQSVDRLHRIGRTEDVLSIILLPNGEFGDRMYKMTREKSGLTRKFIRDLLHTRVV
jgi:SNF2 family DNA or RNA helicase